jgi:hypothetical protein
MNVAGARVRRSAYLKEEVRGSGDGDINLRSPGRSGRQAATRTSLSAETPSASHSRLHREKANSPGPLDGGVVPRSRPHPEGRAPAAVGASDDLSSVCLLIY